MVTKTPPILCIGVLIPEEVQLLDLSTVDLLSMLSQEYLSKAKLPEALVHMGIPEVKIHYIAETCAGSYQNCTGGAGIRITHSLEDEAVQPGNLDIVLIPGPFLPANTSDKVKAFVRAHYTHRGFTENGKRSQNQTIFLVVCTGIFVAGQCGILDGKNATGPRFMLFDLGAMFPKAKWTWSKRWVRDGNLWTSGNIGNGFDMVSAFIKDTYPGVLADAVIYISQLAERPLKYEKRAVEGGIVRSGLWMSGLTLRLLGVKLTS